jgi:hypothetical protein
VLKKASLDEKKRLAYEAREAALMDEHSRINEAREDTALTIAKNLLDVLDDETISIKTGACFIFNSK